MSNMRKPLLDFLGRYIDLNEIEDSTNFYEKGLVNSLFAMQLILFLEEQYQIEITNDDMETENFSSIQAIDKLLNSKCRK